jgi:hypothetical protein
MAKDLPSPEFLRSILRYEPGTGKLFWRERNDCPKQWNTRFAEKEAFTSKSYDGYKRGRINGKKFFAHRAIWAIVHGYWPHEEIDHINGIRDDNSIVNLREASRSENMKNLSIRKDNRSGVIGVCWFERDKIWRAYIMSDGKRKHLGDFKDKEDAIAARKKAEKEYGFHENHGR